MEKGEIVGTPKTPGGGWLVLDKSYQDTGFFASFRCMGGCKTGVMLRAEKTADGMKGAFVSLNEGDLASYNLKLDAQGQEVGAGSPARRRRHDAYCASRGGWWARWRGGRTWRGSRASWWRRDGDSGSGRSRRGRWPRRAGSGRGGGGGGYAGPAGAPVGLRAEEWNTVEVIVDAEVLRASLNAMGASGGGGTGITGGGTGDGTKGFGPVALYVGGTGEVRFKEVSVRDLAPKMEAPEETSSRFKGQRLSDFYYAWSATAADFNHDGVMDVAAGPFYYLGPTYTERREFAISQTFNPSNQYASGMINFAYDFTGDGWADILMTAGRPDHAVRQSQR